MADDRTATLRDSNGAANRAFEFLVSISRDGNLKLRDVAQQIVDKVNQ